MALSTQFPTRRGVLMAAVGALGAYRLTAEEAATKALTGSMTANTPSPSPINFIRSGHDRFEPLLEQHFPDICGWTIYPQVKQMFCLLENYSGLDAKAYSIAWVQSAPYNAAQSHTGYSHFIQKHYMPKRVAHVCRTGSLRLISPTFNLDASEYAAQKARILSMPLSFFPIVSGTRALALDAAILSDSSVQGTDNSRLIAHYVATRHAEHDEGLSVLLALKKSSAPAEIIRILEQHINVGAATRPKDAHSYYDYARGREAHDLLALYTTHGLARLKQRVERMSSYRKETITIPETDL